LNHGSAWAVWRHPIPYEVMSRIFDAANDGRLHIHKAAKAPQWDGKQFVLETNAGKTIKSNHLVDGTSGTNRISSIGSPLIKNLVYKQLIEPNPCGGIDVNPLTFECQIKGQPISGLYSIGPLNKGVMLPKKSGV